MNKKIISDYGLENSNGHRSYAITVWFEGRQVSVKDKEGKEIESYRCEGVNFESLKERLTNYFEVSSNVRYVCCSQERCPSEENGLLHGHLFLRLIDGVSGVKLLRDICGFSRGQAWFEDVRKDFAAFEYSACIGHFSENQPKGKKPPLVFWEKGERPESKPLSKKKDFSGCYAMIQEGRPLSEICAAYPEIALKGFTNLQKLHQMLQGEKQHYENAKRIERSIANSHAKSAAKLDNEKAIESTENSRPSEISPESFARAGIARDCEKVPF